MCAGAKMQIIMDLVYTIDCEPRAVSSTHMTCTHIEAQSVE